MTEKTETFDEMLERLKQAKDPCYHEQKLLSPKEQRKRIAEKLARHGIIVKTPEQLKIPTDEGIIERRDPPLIVNVQNLHMEKDGTNYDLLVFKIRGLFGFGMCGSCGDIPESYLVIEGLNRRAYLFKEFIPDDQYIGEKLSGGKVLSGKDVENIMILMKLALPGGGF